jgi:putative hydrolase of the HAD superfamily
VNTRDAGPAIVVLDLDDTLFLERDYVRSGFVAVGNWAREAVGLEGFATRAIDYFEGGGRGDTFDVVLRDLGHEPDPALIARLVDIYRAHDPAIRPAADATEALSAMRNSLLELGLVTDGPPASQRAKARAMGAHQWSSVNVFTWELGAEFAKPHPRAFEDVERATAYSGAECAYIADNPAKDFVAPRALGWRTIRVRRAGSLHEAVSSGADIDLEVRDLVEALPALGVNYR